MKYEEEMERMKKMKRHKNAKKRVAAVVLALSMLGAGMDTPVMTMFQTTQAETLALTLTAEDNQAIVITDTGYTLVTYYDFNSSLEKEREDYTYSGDYVITGGTMEQPLKDARIRVETAKCNITLKNYHATTANTANLVETLVNTEEKNSLIWNDAEDGEMVLKLEGTNTLSCTAAAGIHSVGSKKGSLTLQGNGRLYLTGVELAGRMEGGTIQLDGPSIRIRNTNDSRGINTLGTVNVKSGEIYAYTTATSLRANAVNMTGGVAAFGSVVVNRLDVNGPTALYMTSKTEGTMNITEGIVYNGTVVGYKNTSSTSSDYWSPSLSGGAGTLYGDPQLSESSYLQPINSNLGIDLSTAGKDESVTVSFPDVGYTGNEAVPAPVICVNKVALHKTLVQGVDFTAQTDSTEKDKIGLGEKKAVVTAISGSGNMNSTDGTFRVVQSRTVFAGGISTFRGNEQTTEFGYGDTITFKVTPKPNGVTTVATAAGAAPDIMEEKVQGTAALYLGEKKLTDDVQVGTDGTCVLAYDTSQGDLRVGSADFTIRYTGNEKMADTSADITVGIGRTIIDDGQVSMIPYTGVYDAATHEAVSVQTPGLGEVNLSYSTSTDQAVWSDYEEECPIVQDAGTLYVRVKVTGDVYQDYTTEPVTVTITRRDISSLSASDLDVALTEGGYYYTATFVTPHPDVIWNQNGREVTLTEGVDYKKLAQPSYTHNIAISDGTGESAPTITIEGIGNYEGSITKKFAIRFYDKKPEYTYSRENHDGWFDGDVTVSADGFTMGEYLTGLDIEDGNIAYVSSYTFTGDGEQKKFFFLKEKGTGYITQRTEINVKIDRTAPTFPEEDESGAYGISLETNWWRELLSKLTFGKYNHAVVVKMRAQDTQSGVKQYYYYVDESDAGVLSKEKLDALDADAWTKVDADGQTEAVRLTELAANTNQVVYAYAVDAVGNKSAYICTDGVAIDTVAPEITELTPPDTETSPITDGTATISFQTDEDGTLYYYVTDEEPETEPTMEQIVAGEKNKLAGYGMVSMKAGKENNLKLTGLKGNTSYIVYVGTVDSAGNMSAVSVIRFKTDKTIPSFAQIPVISGTYGQMVKDMTLSQPKSQNAVTGSWKLAEQSEKAPSVGSAEKYDVVFTPDDINSACVVTMQAVLDVTPKNLNDEGVFVDNVTGTYVYDGTPKIPQIRVTDAYAVIDAGDYDYTYSNNVNATTPGALAQVTVTGKGNYTGTVTRTFTIRKAATAPNLPSAGIRADYTFVKIGEVALPTGWEWVDSDRDKALVVEQPVSATAVYVGDGNGNYEKESIELTVIRKECAHTGGEATCNHRALCEKCGREYGELDENNHEGSYTRGKKEADCTNTGYTGDVYCSLCNALMKEGTEIPAKGHTWDSGRIIQAVTEKEDGIREYKCKTCGATKTETIPAQGTEVPETSASPSASKAPASAAPNTSSIPAQSKEPDVSPEVSSRPRESGEPVIIIRGDVNGDGNVTLLDAQMTLKAALKLKELSFWQKIAANVDEESGITLADAQKILKVALKLDKF